MSTSPQPPARSFPLGLALCATGSVRLFVAHVELWPEELVLRLLAAPVDGAAELDAHDPDVRPGPATALQPTIEVGGDLLPWRSGSGGGGRYAGWHVDHSFAVTPSFDATTVVVGGVLRDGTVLDGLEVRLG